MIPYDEYLEMIDDEKSTIRHEVVALVVKKDYNLVKAWRIHLKLTQKEVAKRAKISQVAASQMERANNILQNDTLKKLAKAMG